MDSPAKLNLHLRVLGRRPDGYHELVTLFHRISLKDRITIKKLEKPIFFLRTNHSALRRQSENLIYKAYQILRRTKRFQGGVEVKLEKQIPLGAGLGGGSSNAAHFLLAMNRLFQLKLPMKKLVRLGTQLGADVPFFICTAKQAIGTGAGEKLKVLTSSRKLWFVVLVPPFNLSTTLVYRKLKAPPLTRISRDATITSAFFRPLRKGLWKDVLRNDLYKTSCAIEPRLKKVEMLFDRIGVTDYLMSGSGSSMFSIHRSKTQAQAVARKMKRLAPRARVFVCHTY
jgi:4-diphosphocytidyl-2-C-methyl-D-erythritol kinase